MLELLWPLIPYATVAAESHEVHHVRRGPLNAFLSKRSVYSRTSALQRPVEILCDRLTDASDRQLTVNLKHVVGALALDVIIDYCFAREPVYLLKRDFRGGELENIDKYLKLSIVNIHLPWLIHLVDFLPVMLLLLLTLVMFLTLPQDLIKKALMPPMDEFVEFGQSITHQIEDIRSEKNKGSGRHTIFHEQLFNSKLPLHELTTKRLGGEAFSLVHAGLATVATVLRGAAYHISANPHIHQKFYAELCSVMPDSNDIPSLQTLEHLPYLNAIVHESLRLCSPITHRQSRQFPDKTLQCDGYTIPAGSLVSVTLPLLMLDETIFPDPHEFHPERWLGEADIEDKPNTADGEKSEKEPRYLQKYLVPYNRGPRMCVGHLLARAELLFVLAVVFRRFVFDVQGVVRERDVDFSSDFMVGIEVEESPGILVKVRKC
ncbi:cytochrome P450 [Aspergillus heterothallicus]